MCKLWSIPDCNLIRTLNGHNCNCSSVTFHPQSTLGQDKSSLNLVSAGFDGTIRFWNLEK
jgi:U4/U6 small nuclear ribonucleoprotein PRP4